MIFFSNIYRYLLQTKTNSCRKQTIINPIYIFLLIIICWIPYWLAYYPGFFNYDPWQVDEYIHNKYSSHHPMIHSFLLGLFYYSLGAKHGMPNLGVALYAVFQMISMAIIFSYTFNFIQKNISNRVFQYFVLVFFCLFPINPILAMSTTKDILFSGLFLLACVFLVENNKEKQKYFSVKFTIICIFMALLRNNCIHAMCLFVCLVIFIWIKTRDKQIKTIIVKCILLTIVLKISLVFAVMLFNADVSNEKEMLSAPAQQMGRILLFSKDNDLKNNIKTIFDKECSYFEYRADSMKDHYLNTKNKNFVAEVLNLSFISFCREPLISIDSFLLTTSGLWDLTTTSSANIYPNQGYLLTDVKQGYGITVTSKFEKLKDICEMQFTKNEYQKIPFVSICFSCAIPTYVVLFSFVIFYSFNKKLYLLMSLFFLSYIVTIAFGPTIIIRYVYPIYIVVPMLLYMMKDSINSRN